MPVIEQKTTNKNKVDFDLNRLDKSKTTIFSKYPIFFMRVTMSANFSITPAAFIPLSFRCPPEKSASSGDRYHLVGSLFQFANPTP